MDKNTLRSICSASDQVPLDQLAFEVFEHSNGRLRQGGEGGKPVSPLGPAARKLLDIQIT